MKGGGFLRIYELPRDRDVDRALVEIGKFPMVLSATRTTEVRSPDDDRTFLRFTSTDGTWEARTTQAANDRDGEAGERLARGGSRA